MTKYRIVGAFNLFFASFQIAFPLILIFVTIPRLTGFYSEFGVGSYWGYFIRTYLVLGFVIVIGLTNLFLGIKLFSQNERVAQKCFKYGLGLVVLNCFFVLICYHFLVWSTIMPILNLASQF
jgi:hypothetical protein